MVNYFLVGSWNDWKEFEELKLSSSRNGNYCCRIAVRKSPGVEEFQIVQERDWAQRFFPVQTGGIEGPRDEHGANWRVEIPHKCKFLEVVWDARGKRSFNWLFISRTGEEWSEAPKDERFSRVSPYFLVGTFNDWKDFVELVPSKTSDSMYYVRVKVRKAPGLEQFQVVLNRDWAKRFYPDRRDGQWEISGPGDKHGCNWKVEIPVWCAWLQVFWDPRGDRSLGYRCLPISGDDAMFGDQAAGDSQLWEIVGGEDRGGVLVREGSDLASAKRPERLSTGAVVEEVELVDLGELGKRLRYRKLTGVGPQDGWISITLHNKALAERLEDVTAGEASEQAQLQLHGYARQDSAIVAACGTRLEKGMRVMVRWQPDSKGFKQLTYLNGHVGVLLMFDNSHMKWSVGLETYDGSIMIGSENLHVCAEGVTTGEAPECEMCYGRFLESQLIVLKCKGWHQYCNDCMRKWVRTQIAPKCYKCLDENGGFLGGGANPWEAVPASDTSPSDYRITKADIDRLDCACAFEVSGGAKCVIIGVQGYIGKTCTVGRVENGKKGKSAAVYLSTGKQLELASTVLEVDDCLSSGRLARGEPCPSKGENFGLGLSVISLGCACPIKQCMDELFIEQLAMPYDWTVSRVEGVLYFFRHAFRDFTYYDDVRQVGENGYTSFRSSYHAFPHHDISGPSARDGFMRRTDRLYGNLVAAREEPTTRPILLMRLCARTSELDFSEELYAAVRAIGGQKVYLLVCITEQTGLVIGAVRHIRHPNLIYYVAGTGSGLEDALRFGMDYAYVKATFGIETTEMARRRSILSPVASSVALRNELRHHAIWLTRDSKGLPPTMDINGCFDSGPNQYFPGRFHKDGKFEASPYFSRKLWDLVMKGTAQEVAQVLTNESSWRKGFDINAWNLCGETVLFAAARRNNIGIVATLLLANADPNCRALDCRLAINDVIVDEPDKAPASRGRLGPNAKEQTQQDSRVPRAKAPTAAAPAAADESSVSKGKGRSNALALIDNRAATKASEPKLSPKEERIALRTLLRLWSGTELVEEDEILATVDALPEPSRRHVVSRMGIMTAPDLLPRRVAHAGEGLVGMAKDRQVLFTKQFMAEAEALSSDHVTALKRLREAAAYELHDRRQVLRVLLRDWHPDKHQGKPQEEQDHANNVFCYCQKMKNIFLGQEDAAAKKEEAEAADKKDEAEAAAKKDRAEAAA